MKSKIKKRTKVIIALEALAFAFFAYNLFVYPITSFVLIVLILYDLKSRADSLIIDIEGITIKNWLSSEKRNYNYRQFDKMVIHFDPIESFGRQDIYLLKDDVIFSKLSGRNFENLDELMNEIERRKIGAR